MSANSNETWTRIEGDGKGVTSLRVNIAGISTPPSGGTRVIKEEFDVEGLIIYGVGKGDENVGMVCGNLKGLYMFGFLRYFRKVIGADKFDMLVNLVQAEDKLDDAMKGVAK